MTLETKYNEGDLVWVLNSKTGKIVQREITGIRTESINQEQKTIYCFIKDCCQYIENPTIDDCFWISEHKVFDSKQKLLASFH